MLVRLVAFCARRQGPFPVNPCGTPGRENATRVLTYTIRNTTSNGRIEIANVEWCKMNGVTKILYKYSVNLYMRCYSLVIAIGSRFRQATPDYIHWSATAAWNARDRNSITHEYILLTLFSWLSAAELTYWIRLNPLQRNLSIWSFSF